MPISSHKYLPSPTCFLHLYYHLLALSTLFFYMIVQVIYNNSQKDANLATSFWQVLTHSTPLRYVPFAMLQPQWLPLNSSNMSCLLPCYPHTRSPPYLPSPSFSCPSDPSVSHPPFKSQRGWELPGEPYLSGDVICAIIPLTCPVRLEAPQDTGPSSGLADPSPQHLAKRLALLGAQQTLVNKMVSSNSSWVDLWPTSCISAHSSLLL